MLLADGSAVPGWVPDFIVDMTVGDIVSFLAAIAFIWLVVRKVRPFFEGIRNFLEDWNGTIARPGVERRAGVMERLDNVDGRLTTVEVELDKANHQLHPNGGSSVADKVNQIKEVVLPTQKMREQ